MAPDATADYVDCQTPAKQHHKGELIEERKKEGDAAYCGICKGSSPQGGFIDHDPHTEGLPSGREEADDLQLQEYKRRRTDSPGSTGTGVLSDRHSSKGPGTEQDGSQGHKM